MIKTSTLNCMFYSILVVSIAIMIGSRSFEVGADTLSYVSFYQQLKDGANYFWGTFEPGFVLFSKLFAFLRFSDSHYIIFLAVLSCSSIFFPFKCKYNYTGFIFISIMLVFPFFYSITTNVVRQGIAFGLLLFALPAVEERDFSSKKVVFTILAVSFHYFALVVGIVLIFVKKFRFDASVAVWILSIFFSYFSLIQMIRLDELFEGFKSYSSYFDGSSSDYRLGFRLDFVIFSFFGLVLAFVLRIKKVIMVSEKLVGIDSRYISTFYVLVNASANIFNGAAYADRFYLWSWMLYPIMITIVLASLLSKNSVILLTVFLLPLSSVIFFSQIIGF